MAFELIPLPYDSEALAPAISAETLSFHHGNRGTVPCQPAERLLLAGCTQHNGMAALSRIAERQRQRGNRQSQQGQSGHRHSGDTPFSLQECRKRLSILRPSP